MMVKKIARYTALVKRRSEILLSSGQSWKPEYEEEMQVIDRELLNLRREMKMDE